MGRNKTLIRKTNQRLGTKQHKPTVKDRPARKTSQEFDIWFWRQHSVVGSLYEYSLVPLYVYRRGLCVCESSVAFLPAFIFIFVIVERDFCRSGMFACMRTFLLFSDWQA